jgi:cell division protein FtsQ
MDGGGRRLAEPLTSSRTSGRGRVRDDARAYLASRRWADIGAFERKLDAWAAAITALNLPRGGGFAASLLIILASVAYGMVRGDHLPAAIATLEDARDSLGNAIGLRIEVIAIGGQRQLTRDDVLASAGLTGHSSLLLFDVAAARARLKRNPWIADATVQMLYPDRLQITITEREAFALWQRNGKVWVMAADGTVLEPFSGQRFTNLPLVVGAGADKQAKEFSALLDRYPDIRRLVRACVLVAERRWNLRLHNGIDVRLPETDVARALDRLAQLNREQKLSSRDITAIDLRLPDRVTVRLSDPAAAAREETLKAKKLKAKGDTPA